MINRIFKTVLVLTICMGLTIPTNAAVSVSDGSAFVTKAEFAADLNNLSNRMAQLENSFDAKIDSLVSSYLTRNGIWNGAKQELNIAWLDDNNFFRHLLPRVSEYLWARKADNIFTANKSGLLFAHFGLYFSQLPHVWNITKNPDVASPNAYTYLCTLCYSVAIAPNSSVWQGDYDGVPTDYIAYSYPQRQNVISRDALAVCMDMMGFVSKDTTYAIWVCCRSTNNYGSDSSGNPYDNVQGYLVYETDKLGFKPAFYIY